MFDSFDATTVVFLVLAVFVILRLRSVLGQRTPRDNPPRNQPAIAPMRRDPVGMPGNVVPFGAAANVGAALERIGAHPKAYVVDFSAVPLIDSTAAATMRGFVRKARRHHVPVYFTAVRPAVREMLSAHGVAEPDVLFQPSIEAALRTAHAGLAPAASTEAPAVAA